MKQKVPTSIKLNIHRLSAYVAMATIFLGSIIGCGQKQNQQNGASDANHMLSQHHIWENPSKLACQNGEQTLPSSSDESDQNSHISMNGTPFQVTLELSCHQGSNIYGLESREYIFSFSVKRFRKDPNKPTAYAEVAVEQYPENFLSDLNSIGRNANRRALCMSSFFFNVDAVLSDKISIAKSEENLSKILITLSNEGSGILRNLRFPRKIATKYWSQNAFFLTASENTEIPLCQRIESTDTVIGLPEARNALADPANTCKKEILFSYLKTKWLAPRCATNSDSTGCRKARTYTSNLVSLLNEWKHIFDSSINNINLDQIWSDTPNKQVAWIRIVNALTVKSLNISEGRIISNNLNPFQPLDTSYGLIRKNEKEYTAVLNFKFVEGCALNTDNPSNFLNEYRKKVTACLAAASPFLYNAEGHALSIELYDPMTHLALHEIPEAIISVSPGTNQTRGDSVNQLFTMDCPTILHETLHHLGLADEYRETIIPYGNYRQLGPSNSIMLNPSLSWDDAIQNATILSNKSVLHAMHFLMITHHNNPITAIEDYLICSADAYTENHQTRNIPVSELPSSCRNGSTNWITHPRLTSHNR